jgi:hypothetical protein
MGSVVRTEREHCCDDIALNYCGDKLVYVKALVSLQELQKEQTPALAMAAVGKKKPLLERVKRMLQPPTRQRLIWEKMTATGLLLAIIAFWAIEAQARHNTSKELPTRKSAMMIDTIIRPEAPLEDATVNIIRIENGQRIKMSMERGEVKYLNVDGQTIPESEYRKYVDLIQEMQEEARSNNTRVPFSEEVQHLSIAIPDHPDFEGDLEIVEPPLPPAAPDFSLNIPPLPPIPPVPSFDINTDGIQIELNGKTITLPGAMELGNGELLQLHGMTLQKLEDGSYQLRGTDQEGESMEIQIFPTSPDAPSRQRIEIDRNNNNRATSPRRNYSWSYSTDVPDAASPADGIAWSEISGNDFTFYLDADAPQIQALKQNQRTHARELQKLEKIQTEQYRKAMEQAAQAQQEQSKILKKHLDAHKDALKHLEQTQKEHAKIAREHADRSKKHADAFAKIRKELVKDGLIDAATTNLSISINDNEVNINGIELQGSAKEKYRRLYRELMPQVTNFDYQ